MVLFDHQGIAVSQGFEFHFNGVCNGTDQYAGEQEAQKSRYGHQAQVA